MLTRTLAWKQRAAGGPAGTATWHTLREELPVHPDHRDGLAAAFPLLGGDVGVSHLPGRGR